MPTRVEMPRLSDTMQQGTVVKWNVKEGQKVKSGDVIADIETDKATMELQSFDDGTVAALVAPEGQTVPVGTLIMLIAAAGEDPVQVKAGAGAASAPAAKTAATQTDSVRQPMPPAGAARGTPAQGAVTSGSAAAVAPPPAMGFSEREDVGSPVGAANFRAGSAAVLAPTNGAAGAAHGNGVGGHGGNASAGAGGRIFASPLARKIAEEAGVDLSRVEGSGPSGRITRKDVEAVMQGGMQGAAQGGAQAPGARAPQQAPGAAAPRAPQPPQPMLSPSGSRLTTRVVPLSNMRRTIARRLVEAKQSIPHYQVTAEVEMDALMALRGQLNEQLAQQGVKLSVNDFIVRACALAMHQHPYVNARWAPGSQPGQENIEFIGEVNVGVAIALPVHPDGSGGGLVVATLRNADQVGLRQISAETKRLSEKARTKGLSIEELSDSTFTISNLGMFGVSHFTAIINPPNVAILAVGAAQERALVKNGTLVPGHVMAMTMSSDHRVVDGAMAAQYLATVKGLLEKPATLLV